MARSKEAAPEAPVTIDPEDFAVVEEGAELSRSAPSPFAPLVDKARKNVNRRMEKTVLRQATDQENGEPLFERVSDDDDTTPRDDEGYALSETGERIPVMERVPYEFPSKAEAVTFADGLRAAATAAKLPRSRLSLRIVADPAFKDGADDDSYRVQFYVIPMGSTNPEQTPNGQPSAPVNVGG